MDNSLNSEDEIEKEINNPELIGQVVKSLFSTIPVSMVYEGDEVPVRIVSATKEFVILRALGRKDQDPRILTFTNNGSLYHFYFRYTDKSTEDLEYLEPEKMVVRKTAPRKTNRQTLPEKSGKDVHINGFLHVNDVIKKIDTLVVWKKIRDECINSLRAKFKEADFWVVKEDDFRAKVLKYTGLPIFLPNQRNINVDPKFANLGPLRNVISESEWEEIRGPEICLPLYFRGKFLVGYTKVRHDKELEFGDYTLVNMLQNMIAKELNQRDKFLFSDEKCKLLDLSTSGVGFLHPKKGYEKSFVVGDRIIMEVHLDHGLYAPLQAIVRNVREMGEENLRVGCEFYELTEEEYIFLNHFSEKL